MNVFLCFCSKSSKGKLQRPSPGCDKSTADRRRQSNSAAQLQVRFTSHQVNIYAKFIYDSSEQSQNMVVTEFFYFIISTLDFYKQNTERKNK